MPEHANATGLTVIRAVPDFDAAVAVIVTRPAATAVTTPPLLTVAMLALPVLQVTGALTIAPFASFGVAVNWAVSPTRSDTVAGLTPTLATGGKGAFTVIAAVPDFDAAVAVIVAVPTATAVTTPLPLTVAMPALLVLQVTVALTVAPLASFGVAVSGVDSPGRSVAVAGPMMTLATVADGVPD